MIIIIVIITISASGQNKKGGSSFSVIAQGGRGEEQVSPQPQVALKQQYLCQHNNIHINCICTHISQVEALAHVQAVCFGHGVLK